MNDKRFVDRIAQAYYCNSTLSDNDAWDKLSDAAKSFWINEIEMFIDATDRARICLYDCDDVR